MASTSVSTSVDIPPQVKYDVFISFRGTDTRKTFTSHLHAALIRRKVETYIDYRLERGDEVGPALLKAIKESKISVIVFSENYADSTWCLDELAYILECKKTHGQHVIPIFYEVDPSHVRYQLGSYATAFAKHEQRSAVKVPMWKEALVKISDPMQFANDEDKTDKERVKRRKVLFDAANLSGFDSRTARNDSDLVEEVVSDVLAKLNRESSSDLTGKVGAEDRIQKILLDLDMMPEDVRVRFLVIWGMGGVGKTTLADAVFHGLSSQFESYCFLANVRERSGTKGAFSPELYALRDQLLGELLGDRSLIIRTRTIGAVEKERLRRTKVFIVLDDVNDSSQLTFLAEEVPFGPGSRIIITTRDMRPVQETLVLKKVADRDVKMHEVKKLNGVESLQLFYSDQSDSPTRWTGNSESLEWRVLDYADGIPLALNILRSLFLQWKGEPEQLWDKLKMFPSEKLQKVYRASYDGLGENEKEIFLDIACFHKTEELCDAKRIMAACALFPDDGIEILVDMSLISIKNDCIWMHDVIQEMGWEIVREECVDNPGKRSRLYTFKDVCHVLGRNKGTAAVKSISLKMAQNYGNVMLTGKAFTEMDNLRFLDFGSGNINGDINTDLECLPDALKCLIWPGYPLKYLPSNFSPKNLVELHMRRSRLQGLWNQGQSPKNLRRIDLCYSSELTEVPDLSNCVNIKSINLEGCNALIHIPSYFHNLTKLTDLNLRGCSKVRKLPESLCKLKSLERLDLRRCTRLEKFPEIEEKMERLEYLSLRETGIEQLPPSIGNLVGLKTLDLTRCDRLELVPSDIYKLKHLENFLLGYCRRLRNLPVSSTSLSLLVRLDLYDCNLLEAIPEGLISSPSLQSLNLSENWTLATIPETIKNYGFTSLNIRYCERLRSLPELSYHLKELMADGCTALEEVSRTAWKEDLDDNDGYMKHTFCGCLNLNDNARSNIMEDARIRIMRTADHYTLEEARAITMWPGKEIPRWFSCQMEGSIINIKLPMCSNLGNVLGIALCVVVTIHEASSLTNSCKSIFTTNRGGERRLAKTVSGDEFWVPPTGNSDHILVWYNRHEGKEFYWATEASFYFYIGLDPSIAAAIEPSNLIEVKRCGVSFVYAKGHESHDGLKFEVIHPLQEDDNL